MHRRITSAVLVINGSTLVPNCSEKLFVSFHQQLPLVLKIVPPLCLPERHSHKAYNALACHRFVLDTWPGLQFFLDTIITSSGHPGHLILSCFPCDTWFWWATPSLDFRTCKKEKWPTNGSEGSEGSGRLQQNGRHIGTNLRGWNHTAGVGAALT